MNRTFLVGVIALGLAASSCKFKHDPDSERYSCKSDSDCGPAWSCITQKRSGVGVCFPNGQCKPETCNGLDDDCDGVVDDIPELGQDCTTTQLGACAPGKVTCTANGRGCAPVATPTAETCDGSSDLDCDGLVGCADPDCEGRAGCGVAGCICRAGAKAEADCGDGVDNDGDGAIDCADSDCEGQSCGAGCICRGGSKHETDCGNALDDDGDGLIDCADPDCLGATCVGGNCGTAGTLDAGSPLGGSDGGNDGGFVDLDGGSDGGIVDLDGGSADGGSDGGLVDLDGGSTDAGFMGYCTARESICDDGIDNDGDGRIDCLDPDCTGLACADGGTCLADGGCQ